jgi:hypothetical protein
MDNASLNKLLQQLHTEVAKDLLNKVKSGHATASDLNAAITLLKHNKVYALPDNSDLADDFLMELREDLKQEFHQI